jgi:hypothetical protein
MSVREKYNPLLETVLNGHLSVYDFPVINFTVQLVFIPPEASSCILFRKWIDFGTSAETKTAWIGRQNKAIIPLFGKTGIGYVRIIDKTNRFLVYEILKCKT